MSLLEHLLSTPTVPRPSEDILPKENVPNDRIRTVIQSVTASPAAVIELNWLHTRSTGPTLHVHDIIDMVKAGEISEDKLVEDFTNIMKIDAPVASMINISLTTWNAPRAFIDQLDRHKFQIEFWEQSFRQLPLHNLFEDGCYYVPPHLRHFDRFEVLKKYDVLKAELDRSDWEVEDGVTKDDLGIFDDAREAEAYFYHDFYRGMQYRYRTLLALGMEQGAARGILGLHTNTRVDWVVSFRGLRHILSKRACWLAQAGYWSDVISDITNQLRDIFPEDLCNFLVTPPCKGKGYCPCARDVAQRFNQDVDRNPICPIFLQKYSDPETREERTEEHHEWYPDFQDISDRYISSVGGIDSEAYDPGPDGIFKMSAEDMTEGLSTHE